MRKLLTIASLATFAVATGPAVAQKVKWDLSTEYNTTHFVAGGYHVLTKQLAERTAGQVELVIHWGGALGFKSVDQVEAVGNGSVPIADTSSSFLSGVDPLFTLSSIPFMAPSIKEARVLYDLAKPVYDGVLEKRNQMLLAAYPFPPTGIWSKRPITSADQLKGLKIRTYDVMGQNTFRAAGSFPIQLSFPDVLPQLATGGIEAVLTSATGGASVKFWEQLSNFVEINYAYPLQMLHVNRDAFGKLTPAQQQAFRESAKAAEDHNWNEVIASLAKTHETLRSNKVNVVTVPPRDLQQALGKAAESTIAEWTQRVGPRARTLLDEYKKRIGS